MKIHTSSFKNFIALIAILALGPLGCGGDDDGDDKKEDGEESSEKESSKSAKKKKTIVESAIDSDALAALLGKYESPGQDSPEYFKVEISAETIRCNHSNYTSEYKNHKYSVAVAEDGNYLLIAKDGWFKATNGGDDESWNFEAQGICEWGLTGPHTKKEGLTGAPTIGIHPELSGKAKEISAELDEEVSVPWGTVTVEKISASKWKDDDGITHVVEVKLSVENSSEAFVEFTLPELMDDYLSGAWISAECDDGDISSSGVGNTLYDGHKSPAFAEGGGWVSVSAPVGPGKSRKGWVTLLLDDEPSDECTITVDAASLGAGEIVVKGSDL